MSDQIDDEQPDLARRDSRRIRRASRRNDPQLDAPQPDSSDADLKPSRMRGTEAMYGYLVAAELLVIAILNLAVTHGRGAPKHPPTALSAAGVVAAIALVGIIRIRNRTVAGFGAILAAYVISLPTVPNSIRLYHIFALAFPVAYALVVAQRQRKATLSQVRNRPRAANDRATRPAGPSRRQRRPKGGSQAPVPTGPRPNRRYTPPKAKGRRG